MKIASMVIATFACCERPHVVGMGVGMPTKANIERLIANEEERAGKCSNVTVATMMHSECLAMCSAYVENAVKDVIVEETADEELMAQVHVIRIGSPDELEAAFEKIRDAAASDDAPTPDSKVH